VASVDSHTSLSTLDEMDDDELALLGAPWAKEGMLQHKQYWEIAGKRAKKNDWKHFFVVVSKGELFMFTFGDRGGGGFAGGSVGGGNWLVSDYNES
jgi:PH/SEC7 domain-containing protein